MENSILRRLEQEKIVPWRSIKLEEGIFHILIYFQNCSLIAASIAVVGCAKDGDNVCSMKPIKALHDIEKQSILNVKKET